MTARPSILCYGHCHADWVHRILKAIPSVAERFEVVYCRSFVHPLTGGVSVPEPEQIRRCVLLVYQALPYDKLFHYARELVACGKSFRFPILYCDPPWPQQVDGSYDPRYPGEPLGRYPFGDRVLQQLLSDAPGDAGLVRAYAGMDFSRLFDLDGMEAKWQRNILRADEAADVKLASFLSEEWKQQRLFWTFNHPANALLEQVVLAVLPQVLHGRVPRREIEQALAATEMDGHIVPVHPSVARHFGLNWFDANARYHHPDGRFTAEEWALRYVRYIRTTGSRMAPAAMA